MLLTLSRCRVCPLTSGSSRMPKARAGYYAVAKGRKPGVYKTWDECQAQVTGFPGAKHKKFPTEAEARAFVFSVPPPPAPVAATGTGVRKATPAAGGNGATAQSAGNVKSGSMPDRSTKGPAHPLEEEGFTVHNGHLVVYTDGSSLSNGRDGAAAGAGVFFGHGGRARELNVSERVGGEAQTNNRGELLSIIIALESDPHPDVPIEIRTDSQYSINCITSWAPGWIKRGWKTANGGAVKNVDMIKYLVYLLEQREQPVLLSYVRGHNGEPGNEAADFLARTGAMRPLPAVPRTFNFGDKVVSTLEEEKAAEKLKDKVHVEFGENCLMTDEELRELEKELAEE